MMDTTRHELKDGPTMNSQSKQRNLLRSKTGCLTCRGRRKKCDEIFPICGLCSISERPCQWPASHDLLDRRYASHPDSRHITKPSGEDKSIAPSDRNSKAMSICLQSEMVSYRNVHTGLEMAISRHFIEKYYGLLILPNSHPDFYREWITEIQYLMIECKSLFHSVLANGASHLHFVDALPQMQELALTYYSGALKDLSKLLANTMSIANDNGFLMSVMLLYLHGCMGQGTYTDIPRHIMAATRIIAMRLFDNASRITRPFNRLAVESVLYQVFLISTGLWSEDIPLEYEFDPTFWREAEQLLADSELFPGRSQSLNSPVLGVPISLFRLAIYAKQHFQNPASRHAISVLDLRQELTDWEAFVLCDEGLECFNLADDEQSDRKHIFYRDCSYLYILYISLLLEQIDNDRERKGLESNRNAPDPVSKDAWQVIKATNILRSHLHDEEWKMCFMGNWPIYTIGFFMSDADDIELVRSDINSRWRLQKFGQLARFSHDLESEWAKRDDRE